MHDKVTTNLGKASKHRRKKILRGVENRAPERYQRIRTTRRVRRVGTRRVNKRERAYKHTTRASTEQRRHRLIYAPRRRPTPFHRVG